MMPTNAPRWMANEMSCSTAASPYPNVTSRNSIAGSLTASIEGSPAFTAQQIDEEGTAAQRGDHADRNLGCAKGAARDGIGKDEEGASDQHRRGQQQAIIRTDQQARDVRDDQPDEADHPAHRHRGADQQLRDRE